MRMSSETRLLGVVVLAFFLRVVWLDSQSFSMDEVAELATAKLPIHEIVWYPDSMPPGYSLLLKGFLFLFPQDFAARWLSVLFGTASVVCVWGIGRELIHEKMGLAAALITSLLPLHLLYSQYIRSYIVFFFFAALSTWLLARAMKDDSSKDWLGFVFSSLCGVYVHYYFAIFLATCLILAILMRWNFWIGRKACVAFVAIGLFALPLFALLPVDLHFQKSLRAPQPLGIASYTYTYFSFFSGYSLGPSRAELHTLPASEAARMAAPWAIGIALFATSIGCAGLRELQAQQRAGLVVVFLLLPPLFIGVLGYTLRLNYHVRFVSWCMIPLALLLGAGMSSKRHVVSIRVALLGLLVLCAIAIAHRNYLARYQHEDFRSAAIYLKSHKLQSEPIFVLSDYLTDALEYYGETNWQVVRLPRPQEVNMVIDSQSRLQEALEAIAASTRDSERYWLLYSRAFHGDPEQLLLDKLSRGKGFSLMKSFAGIKLYYFTKD